MGLIENMLNSSFGEPSSKMKVTFKKTVKVREYETEVIEATNELELDKEVTNGERVMIASLLKCQMEYMVYSDLLIRGTVTEQEFKEKRAEIENTIETFINKMNSLGIDVSKYIKS